MSSVLAYVLFLFFSVSALVVTVASFRSKYKAADAFFLLICIMWACVMFAVLLTKHKGVL